MLVSLLDVCDSALKLARRYAEATLEAALKVALIEEADGCGDVANRIAASQTAPAFPQTQMRQIAMRGNAVASRKAARKLMAVDARNLHQLVERNVLSEMRIDPIAHALDGAARRDVAANVDTHTAVAPGNCVQEGTQIMRPFELAAWRRKRIVRFRQQLGHVLIEEHRVAEEWSFGAERIRDDSRLHIEHAINESLID